LIAVTATVLLVVVRRGLKSRMASKVAGTVLRGALVGAARALPRLVLMRIVQNVPRA
jgi:hypothetical protein